MIGTLGLGTWALGGPYEFGWGPVDDNRSMDLIRSARSRGVTWLDTAPAYGTGHAERVVGRAIRDLPPDERPAIFTKVGRVWTDESPGSVFTDLRPANLRGQIEASLSRLGVDNVACIQVHRPDRESSTPLEQTWEQLAQLAEEGYASALGLCNVSDDEYRRCAAVRHVDYVQLPASLVRPPDERLLDACAGLRTRTLAFSPLGSGLLSGHFSPERLAPDDWRARNRFFAGEYLAQAERIVDELRSVADEVDATVPAVAIAWALADDRISSCIVGARTLNQLDGWVGAAGIELTQEQREKLSKALSD
ncbi:MULTISPECIES: aldo/keto reductase [Paenarthrobacter]|uniref:aldo/keto reductase n=1 Tax=Paenarthrobacter TaxID=1742992 RepID=UPI00074D42BB|nr:aldo/keto reductase [Paenarthrobacter ureafaciens]AMB40204.1 hypothetical protein AUT26_08275 [Arthrobacter sp. ATCC 21022]RWW91368.1 aldo/keto reductase [Paenarthrobacter ureafaciens]